MYLIAEITRRPVHHRREGQGCYAFLRKQRANCVFKKAKSTSPAHEAQTSWFWWIEGMIQQDAVLQPIPA
jgi:hypothetical protein